MRVLVEGHAYVLNSVDGSIQQQIHFIQKEPSGPGTRLKTVQDGTTNEEVLAVLINRMQFLQAQSPCRENAIVITKLEECLMWLNKRTDDRKARNVEGTTQP